MAHRLTFFTKALLFTMCLVLGCSKGGAEGCSGSTEQSIDSKQLGVYKITGLQSSKAGRCDRLTDVPQTPAYVVLYGFHPDGNPGETRLGGGFCGDVGSCRAFARAAAESAIGYSFIEGNDASGWRGWAILDARAKDDDMCQADVQSHVLTSGAANTIRIETRTVHAVFEPTVEEGVATCRNKDAIGSATEDLPCKGLLVVEAELESGL